MAITVVNKKQTGSTAAAKLTIPAATAGNLLVMFGGQTGDISNMLGEDNVSGQTGWSTNATKSVFATNANSLWVMTKVAVGGETELKLFAGGTGQGISYFELSGCSTTVDAIVHIDNASGAKTVTSPAMTTTNAGSIILAAVSDGAGSLGKPEAWTGTGPLTNVETVATRCMGGFYLPGSTLSSVTFTANWETSRIPGLLVIALKPSAVSSSRSSEDTVAVAESTARSLNAPRGSSDPITVAESTIRAFNAPRKPADTLDVADTTTATSHAARNSSDTVTVTETTRDTAGLVRRCEDPVTVTDTAARTVSLPRAASDTVTVTDAATFEYHPAPPKHTLAMKLTSHPALDMKLTSHAALEMNLTSHPALNMKLRTR